MEVARSGKNGETTFGEVIQMRISFLSLSLSLSHTHTHTHIPFGTNSIYYIEWAFFRLEVA
jgi:hypothetical protein